MSRSLADDLHEAGCKMDQQRFKELLEERKATTSPTWTIDDLVCHPEDAKKFCELIRTETGCIGLSDYLILRALLNVRKAH